MDGLITGKYIKALYCGYWQKHHHMNMHVILITAMCCISVAYVQESYP